MEGLQDGGSDGCLVSVSGTIVVVVVVVVVVIAGGVGIIGGIVVVAIAVTSRASGTMGPSSMHAGSLLYEVTTLLAIHANYFTGVGVLDFNLVSVANAVKCRQLVILDKLVDSAGLFLG